MTEKVLAIPTLNVVAVPPDAGLVQTSLGPVTVRFQAPEVTVAPLLESVAVYVDE